MISIIKREWELLDRNSNWTELKRVAAETFHIPIFYILPCPGYIGAAPPSAEYMRR